VTRRPLASIITLGCKLNLADSEEIARGLARAGFDTCGQLSEADAFVINTCSVTHVADQKSRRLIRSARRLAPGAVVTVTGCYPQTAGFDRVRDLGADLVVGTRDGDKAELVAFVARQAGQAAHQTTPSPAPVHTRRFIKAQEGCNDVCAFCIVPRTRHREVSRPIDRVVAEVNAAVEAGAREVVLTGTQLGAWGRDLEPPLRPHDLIAAILEETEVARLRFSSLQPQDISAELLALWSDPRLMPHFHLALQSGSDSVLTAMRRRYTASEYRDAVARIRGAVPGVAITTDVIAGFPGESDGDFEATLALCREAALSRIHAFPYSQRSGTTAARITGQLAPAVKKARMTRLLELGRELAAVHTNAHRGDRRPVLWEDTVETSEGALWRGYTDNYIPSYAAGSDLRNRITTVKLETPFRDGLLAGPEGYA
jgi:threonylcarbamoyladenosine tRNA methylthiotransferase MtaB